MKSKRILFFATLADIEPIVKITETSFSMKYYEMGLFDSRSLVEYDSVFEIPDFGFPKVGDWNKDLRLIAIPKEMSLVIREVPQRVGAIKYAIDPLVNHKSICFQFGGVYQDRILLAGNCFTTNPNDFSLQVFKVFSSRLRKNFKKIGSFYVGEEAKESLKKGWRLVTNEKSPKEYDLALF